MIDLQPTLSDQAVLLRPLREGDFEALHQAASDPVIWAMHPDSERYRRERFHDRFFQGAIESKGALVIVDKPSGEIIGSSRFYKWNAEQRHISVGYTFIVPKYWGKGTNGCVKSLMLNHIFQWAEVVWFHVGSNNIRSRRAVEKLGAVLTREESRELDGKPYTQLFYSLDATRYDSSR
ncbi:MAG: GNAT family N-acetyltransferase [Pseudomonadota bacterium]